MNDNGQGPKVELSPQAVIDALVARVQQLTVENLMLQAAIDQLQRQQQVPETEPVENTQ